MRTMRRGERRGGLRGREIKKRPGEGRGGRGLFGFVEADGTSAVFGVVVSAEMVI